MCKTWVAVFLGYIRIADIRNLYKLRGLYMVFSNINRFEINVAKANNDDDDDDV